MLFPNVLHNAHVQPSLNTPLTPNRASPPKDSEHSQYTYRSIANGETLDKETGARWSSPMLQTARKPAASPGPASADHRAAVLLRQAQYVEAESVLLQVLGRQRPPSPSRAPEGARSARPFVQRTPVKALDADPIDEPRY